MFDLLPITNGYRVKFIKNESEDEDSPFSNFIDDKIIYLSKLEVLFKWHDIDFLIPLNSLFKTNDYDFVTIVFSYKNLNKDFEFFLTKRNLDRYYSNKNSHDFSDEVYFFNELYKCDSSISNFSFLDINDDVIIAPCYVKNKDYSCLYEFAKNADKIQYNLFWKLVRYEMIRLLKLKFKLSTITQIDYFHIRLIVF